jgi:trigger factor
VKTTVEKLSPTRAKLTITVAPDELKPSITHAYGHIAEQVSIPGFRKGKVPPPIIDQRVGRGAVLEHAVNEGLDTFYRQAVEETELRPLGQPSADIAEWPEASDFSGDLVLSIEVDIRPEIELPKYEGIELTVEPALVTGAEVDEELDRLRARFGTLVTVDRPAKTGDFAQIDLSATIGDEEVDTASGISYEIGSGELIDGLDEAIDSLTAGEQTTFRSKLVGGDHEGEEAEVAVTLISVKERELPEADDDFAQIASEFDTIDDLKAGLRSQLERSKVFGQGTQARDQLVEKLLDLVEIPVPDQLVEDEVHRHLESENRLEDDEHRAEVAISSERAFRTQILLDDIVAAEEVGVGQDELMQYLIQGAGQYGMEPNEFVKVLSENNQIPAMVGEVARNKALAIVLGKAIVKDSDGRSVDLSEFTAVPGSDDAQGDAEAAVGVDESAEAEAPAKKPAKARKKSTKKVAEETSEEE